MSKYQTDLLLSFDDLDKKSKTLYVQEDLGIYRKATVKEVLLSARNQVGRVLGRDQMMNRSEKVKAFCHAKLSGFEHEVFGCLFLDNQLNLIEYQEMFHGTVASASVYPREVAKVMLRLNASALIITHNHPSGVAQPSREDLDLTKDLASVLKVLGCRLIDHILVAGANCLSFEERGYMRF